MVALNCDIKNVFFGDGAMVGREIEERLLEIREILSELINSILKLSSLSS